ncbi:MAG: peptidoglycan-binding protein, partial [Ruminococcus sp.]|nr:peptidoglycan-binding protein [Ruminococcus sp.]
NVDGYYGNASKTACIAFQKKYGLTQDGKFGSASLSKMKEMLKKPTTATKKTTTTTKKKTTTTTKKKTTTTKKKTTTTKKKTTTTKKKTTTTKKSTTTTKKATTTTYDTNFKSYTVPTRNLSYNSSSIMTGNDVKWFQSAINYLIIKGDKDGNKLSTSKLTVNGSYNSASKTACIAFQKKYGLDADGIFGPASLSKMKLLLNITPVSSEVTYFNSNDTTQLTKHFKVSEFRCKCGGSHQTKLNVALVYKLEELMGVIGADKAIVSSGYRCSKHDINVGGSGSGQHTYGNAVDICFYDKNGKVISTKIVSCRAQDLGFTGIANINKNYTYIHLDVRTSGKYYGNEIYGYNTVTNDFYAYYGISR